MRSHVVRLTRGWRGRVPATTGLALLLLAAAAGGAAATTGHLHNPTVSTRTAVAGTSVAFAVTFSDNSGAAPQWVVLDIDGVRQPMTATANDYRAGVQYTLTLTPATGQHVVRFRARDASGSDQSAWGGYVTITAPATPTPGPSTPAPTSTPVVTAPPTTRPSPTATPWPTSTVGSPTPTSTPVVTAPPTTRPIPTARPRPSSGSSAGPGTSPTATPVGSPSKAPAVTAAATPATGGTGGTSGGGSRPTVTPPAATGPGTAGSPAPSGAAAAIVPSSDESGLPAVAVGHVAGLLLSGGGTGAAPSARRSGLSIPLGGSPMSPSELALALAPSIVTTGTGIAAWAAFMMFGKRRRDDDETVGQTLATAAASCYEVDVTLRPRVVDEALIPRWRRPSLQQVRKSDPLRVVVDAPRLSFEAAGVLPLENHDRRQIAYRLVRLLDSPDEFRSQEIGVLDQGDEVQLLERRGVYWLVLCPDGRTGWLHRMVLADPAALGETTFQPAYQPLDPMALVEPGAFAGAAAVATAEATDEDLLEVYLRARGDVLRSLGDERFSSSAGSGAASLPGAAPKRADARCSARKRAGTRKGAGAYPPGTR
jgi:hypothetical protein